MREVASYLFYSKQPTKQDGSITNHISLQETKEQEKRLQDWCFAVNFAEFLRRPLFKNTYDRCFWRWAWQNQTNANGILIEQMLSLNDSFWIILSTHQNGHVVTFFYSRPKVKMRQNWMENSFFILFEKGNFSLDGSAITPNVPPQLYHWYFTELYSPVTSSLHSSCKTYIKGE